MTVRLTKAIHFHKEASYFFAIVFFISPYFGLFAYFKTNVIVVMKPKTEWSLQLAAVALFETTSQSPQKYSHSSLDYHSSALSAYSIKYKNYIEKK